MYLNKLLNPSPATPFSQFTVQIDVTKFEIIVGSTYMLHQVEQLVSSANYIVCFDESLNEVIQKEQMDIYVRLCDLDRNSGSKLLFFSFFRSHHC